MLGHYGTPPNSLDELTKLRAELAEVVHGRTHKDVRRAVLHRQESLQPACGANLEIVVGCRLDPKNARLVSGVKQRAPRRARDPEVAGSSPIGSTTFRSRIVESRGVGCTGRASAAGSALWRSSGYRPTPGHTESPHTSTRIGSSRLMPVRRSKAASTEMIRSVPTRCITAACRRSRSLIPGWRSANLTPHGVVLPSEAVSQVYQFIELAEALVVRDVDLRRSP